MNGRYGLQLTYPQACGIRAKLLGFVDTFGLCRAGRGAGRGSKTPGEQAVGQEFRRR